MVTWQVQELACEITEADSALREGMHRWAAQLADLTEQVAAEVTAREVAESQAAKAAQEGSHRERDLHEAIAAEAAARLPSPSWGG